MKVIKVIDTYGKVYQSTYERRAKGLVKKQRAYYIDDATICLVNPLETMEETTMNITKQDILTRIDEVLQSTNYIKEALMTIEKIPNSLEDGQVSLRTMAIANIVKEREATHRQVLQLLETMYQDVKETINEESKETVVKEIKEEPIL